ASLHRVQRILDEFRAGKRDVAEFWIQMRGRFIHIRYFPLRDEGGQYRGTLEVVQDVTDIRALQGERRLLD
ncbi:MAG: PAS domain-containing protein, partial [Anaerolineae bacterium]|nr:PAS domain-containing protein [Anaerolineae bacterium]